MDKKEANEAVSGEVDTPAFAENDYVDTEESPENFEIKEPIIEDSAAMTDAAPADFADIKSDKIDEAPQPTNLDDLIAEDKQASSGKKSKSAKTTAKSKASDEPKAETKNETKKPASRNEALAAMRQREEAREERRTDREQFFAGWSALNTAMKTRRIVNGTVAGVEEINLAGTEREKESRTVALAVIIGGIYKVIIPFDEIYRDDPIDRSTVNLETNAGRDSLVARQKQMAEKLFGISIPFLITFMAKNDNAQYAQDGDYSIGGSRKQAIEIIEKANYEPRRGADAIITEGSYTGAYITAIGHFSVSVNVGGIDTQIPLRNLTFRYVNELQTAGLYKVGDTINVCVSSVKKRADGAHVIVVNAKGAELEAAKKNKGILPIGTRVIGVLTSVRPSRTYPNRIVMTAYLSGYAIPALVRAMPPDAIGHLPQSGDEVRLTIEGFNDAGFALATCRGFNGAAGLFNR